MVLLFDLDDELSLLLVESFSEAVLVEFASLLHCLVALLVPSFRLLGSESALYFNGSDDILLRIILALKSRSEFGIDVVVGVVLVGIPPSPMARNILIFLAIAGFSWQGVLVPAPAAEPGGPLKMPRLFSSLRLTSSFVLVAILLEYVV